VGDGDEVEEEASLGNNPREWAWGEGPRAAEVYAGFSAASFSNFPDRPSDICGRPW
jgi:hypothetical protein